MERKQLSVWIPGELDAELRRTMELTRRTKQAEVELALEQYLGLKRATTGDRLYEPTDRDVLESLYDG
jgi:hypothetical protein